MKVTGHCYCGSIHYEAESEPATRTQCHCRECQYLTGGGPNYIISVPREGFRITRGEPASFTRSDLETPVTRLFCSNCGTQLASLVPGYPKAILKVGTLDDPAVFGAPQAAIFTIDKQAFHVIPDGLPQFERMPTRA